VHQQFKSVYLLGLDFARPIMSMEKFDKYRNSRGETRPHISESFVKASDLSQQLASLAVNDPPVLVAPTQKPKFKLVLKPKNTGSPSSGIAKQTEPEEMQTRPSSSKPAKNTTPRPKKQSRNTEILQRTPSSHNESFSASRGQTPQSFNTNQINSPQSRILKLDRDSGRHSSPPQNQSDRHSSPRQNQSERHSSPRQYNNVTPRKNGNGNKNYGNGSSAKKRNVYAP
jgi:hypothetical protein